MKSRLTTYVLIVAVVAVWGFVAWKIFFARPDSPVPVLRQAQATEPDKETGEKLSLDYRDPFLKGAAVAKTQATPAKQTPLKLPPKTPAAPTVTLPFKYTGTISAGGRRLYIFEHAGEQHLLSEGEELAGFRLAETYADYVRFAKNGEFFTIHTQI
jgi:type II secretory pathway component PulC